MLTGRAAVFLPEREREWRRGTEEEEEDDKAEEQRGGMGVGKNTTSKSMDSTAEPGKYEEENKHSAHFYPIPVSVCACVYICVRVCACVELLIIGPKTMASTLSFE